MVCYIRKKLIHKVYTIPKKVLFKRRKILTKKLFKKVKSLIFVIKSLTQQIEMGKLDVYRMLRRERVKLFDV